MSKNYIFYVYILSSKRNGALYIGVTKDLLNRNFQHKLKRNAKSFTAKYKNRLHDYSLLSQVNKLRNKLKQA